MICFTPSTYHTHHSSNTRHVLNTHHTHAYVICIKQSHITQSRTSIHTSYIDTSQTQTCTHAHSHTSQTKHQTLNTHIFTLHTSAKNHTPQTRSIHPSFLHINHKRIRQITTITHCKIAQEKHPIAQFPSQTRQHTCTPHTHHTSITQAAHASLSSITLL